MGGRGRGDGLCRSLGSVVIRWNGEEKFSFIELIGLTCGAGCGWSCRELQDRQGETGVSINLALRSVAATVQPTMNPPV